MGRSKWLLLLLIPMLFGFDTRNPFRTRGPFKAYDFTVGSVGANCTDGVNCYCDVADASGLIICEDFEDVNYYTNTSTGPIAGSGSPFDRGGNWRWLTNYSGPSFGGNSKSSDPAPTLGTACGYSLCNGYREYCSTAQGTLAGAGQDCWGPGINVSAGIDMQRSLDFKDENASLTLTGGNGATADVFDGKAHMAYRVPLSGNDVGNGRKAFAGATSLSITMAHAYGSNTGSTGVLSQPWKHEEWYGTGGDGGFEEHWNLGATGIGGSGDNTYFPYQPFFWASSVAACHAALDNPNFVVHVGSVACFDTIAGIGFSANGNAFPTFPVTTGHYENSGVTAYNRSADFPYGTWACHQAQITGMGTTNVTVKIWHNETLIIHFSGLDSAAMKNKNYSHFFWNAYSNQAQLQGGGLSQVAYRYRDNVHIKSGSGDPVACSAIGF